jgi:nicotinamidase-related amidase
MHKDRTVTIQPRYYRLFTDPGIEQAVSNYAYAELDWEIPLDEAALVCLDVWNRTPWAATDTQDRGEEIVRTKIVPVLETCRAQGMQVVHAPANPVAPKSPNWVDLIDDDEPQPAYPKSPDWPPADFRRKTGRYAMYARPQEPQEEAGAKFSAEERDFHPLVRPVDDEAVIANGEELHRLCAQRDILHLFYVGFHTNACIVIRDYGVYHMLYRGYHTILIRDCTTGMELHDTQDELICTRGQIASLEQFDVYTITSNQMICSLQRGGAIQES